MTSSNGNSTGAASAAPALPVRQPDNVVSLAVIDQWERNALSLLEDVATMEAAEQLLRSTRLAESVVKVQKCSRDRQARWAAIGLMAERRYGELLPPKQPGKRTDRQPPTGSRRSPTEAEQKATERARQVADVPKPKFEEYVKTEPKPSRAGLLNTVRAAVKPKVKPSKPEPPPVDPRNRHGKKPTKAERRGVLWRLHDAVMDFTTALEHIDPRVCDVSDPANLEALVHIRDALIDLDVWKGDVERIINDKLGDQGIREKIATLRNPAGKYPAELKRCQEVADRLERRLNQRLSA